MEAQPLGVISRADLPAKEGIWQDVLMLFNPFEGSAPFQIPQIGESSWVLELSTSETAQTGVVITQGQDFELEGRSMALFRRP